MVTELSSSKIKQLFQFLNLELEKEDRKGELYLVGGAVMCLVFNARTATRDVDALFEPAKIIREAARRIAQQQDLPDNWLNDGVKGFLSENASFNAFMELSHLRVLTAAPEYLLAMKCLAMRIGEEFHDVNDVRYLLRYLNLENYQTVLSVIGRYYPIEKFPQKTLYALEELLEEK